MRLQDLGLNYTDAAQLRRLQSGDLGRNETPTWALVRTLLNKALSASQEAKTLRDQIEESRQERGRLDDLAAPLPTQVTGKENHV